MEEGGSRGVTRTAIIAGGRTPFVKAGKALAKYGPLALATHAIRNLSDPKAPAGALSDIKAFPRRI